MNTSCKKPLTIFPYIGGKVGLLPVVLPRLPPNRVYIEPFLGSGSVLLNREKSKREIVAEAGPLLTFWRVLQSSPDELIAYIVENLQRLHHKENYFRVRDEVYKKHTPLETAALVFLAITFSYRGTLTPHGYNDLREPQKTRGRVTTRLRAAAQRIRDVEIKSSCWEALACATPDSTIYCDPPYIGTEAHYPVPFTKADHIRLARTLQSLPTKDWRVSYFLHPVLPKLYPNCEFYTFARDERVGNAQRRKSKKVTEVLVGPV